jgi:hypothetical protein
MKNEYFTVIPQNMVAYQMSIREADNENDLFRIAFDDAIKEDPVAMDDPRYMEFYDFFKYGWAAAVRLLNDDDDKAILDVGIGRNDQGAIIVAIHLKRNDHTAVLYCGKHHPITDSFGYTELPNVLFQSVTKGEPLADLVKASLNTMTDEERLEIFNHYCKHCGSTNTNCYCARND